MAPARSSIAGTTPDVQVRASSPAFASAGVGEA